MADRAPLSVVVPTRDRPGPLASSIAALRTELGPADELLVVDSASAVPVDQALRCARPGASRARNAGWRAARHELVAFVDDDVQVCPGWADALVAAFAPGVAFVAGAVGVPVGQEDRERPVAVTTLTAPTRITASTRGTTGATANLAVRRSALQAVGGFDERLGPGTPTRAAEDLDLLDRLLAAGLEGTFAPDARAEHDQWRTRRQLVRLDLGYGVGQGVRLALLLRRGDRARAAMAWRDGVVGTARDGLRDLRHGYRLGVVLAAVRLLGTAAGLVRGSVL